MPSESGPGAARPNPRAILSLPQPPKSLPPLPPGQACRDSLPTRDIQNSRRNSFWTLKTTHTCCFWDSTGMRVECVTTAGTTITLPPPA